RKDRRAPCRADPREARRQDARGSRRLRDAPQVLIPRRPSAAVKIRVRIGGSPDVRSVRECHLADRLPQEGPMNMSMSEAFGSSAAQRALWGARAADWAEGQEPTHEALYLDVLERVAIQAGSRLLDAGCGSGLFCALASKRGLRVSGFDATEPLL